VKNILKKSPVVLALFLLLLGCFYLFSKLFGYTFVSAYGLVLNIFSAAIIITLTVFGIIYRNEKTKLSAILSALLPLIAIFFIVSKDVASNDGGTYTHIIFIIIHTCVTLICSLMVLFACGKGIAVKIVLGIIYIILFIPIFFVLLIMLFMWDFGQETVVKSAMSPNAVYLAEIVDSDQGALGGNTTVNVTQQGCDINLLIGQLKKDPKTIYVGRWGEFETMALRWETDEILYINGVRYIIP